MLIQAIGASLPAAMAVALSPFPIIGVVMLLAGQRGVRGGVAFAGGWVTGVALVASVVVLALGEADEADSTSSVIANWGRVAAGAALIVLGIRKWLRRPRSADDVAVPRWTASLDSGSWTVIGAVATHLVGGEPGRALLDSVRRFMVANSTAIVVVVMLILGANVLGGGLEGLGR